MSDPLARLDDAKSNVGGGGIQLGWLFRLLRRRAWVIVLITVVVPTVVGFKVSREQKVFEASTSIIIDMTVPQYMGANYRDMVEAQPSMWSARESLTTEFTVITSRSQAISVAKALCERKFGPNGAPALQKLLPTATCNGDAAEYERAAPILQGLTVVDPQPNSRVVYLKTTSDDPEFAALLSSTIAHVYEDRNLEKRLAHSAGASSWLQKNYGELQLKVGKADQALLDFRRKNNIVAINLEDDQNELSSKRKRIADERNALEVKLIVLNAQREQLQSVIGADPLLELNPILADSSSAQKLKELYLEQYGRLIQLKSRYLEKHPDVMAQEEQLSRIKTDLRREMDMARKGVELQFKTYSKQRSDLDAALNETTKRALQLEVKASQYNSLKREFESLLKLTESVGGREKDTELSSQIRTNNVHVLDEAKAPTTPISPNVPRAVGVAAAIALVLAIGLALLLESLDNTVKSQEDIEKRLGVTFLGLLPTIDPADRGGSLASAKGSATTETGHSSRDLYVHLFPKSSVAECCRSIRTNLMFMSPDKPTRTLLVTSAGPKEGKTTVATNLAIAMAQSGQRVLLVDTDMRRPRLHKALGVPTTTEGVSKAIVGEGDVLKMVKTTDVPNLWLLPCGACPPNPAELLHAERFRRVVAELSAAYDRVVFDSPPVGLVTDAAILARLTDGTILVSKAGRTTRDSLARAYQAVWANGEVNVLGCILNDLDLSKQGRYGAYSYYYQAQYGTYYGQPKDEPAEKKA